MGVVVQFSQRSDTLERRKMVDEIMEGIKNAILVDRELCRIPIPNCLLEKGYVLSFQKSLFGDNSLDIVLEKMK